ncbi:MAG: hypothetical protein BWY52_02546 [Chloroflexi bacterium ADurb.Bin325]|nr:MAG: hypothetical protein BWY52_02546 [Chloroflexi bacterium ADurb.Bin325]
MGARQPALGHTERGDQRAYGLDRLEAGRDARLDLLVGRLEDAPEGLRELVRCDERQHRGQGHGHRRDGEADQHHVQPDLGRVVRAGPIPAAHQPRQPRHDQQHRGRAQEGDQRPARLVRPEGQLREDDARRQQRDKGLAPPRDPPARPSRKAPGQQAGQPDDDQVVGRARPPEQPVQPPDDALAEADQRVPLIAEIGDGRRGRGSSARAPGEPARGLADERPDPQHLHAPGQRRGDAGERDDQGGQHARQPGAVGQPPTEREAQEGEPDGRLKPRRQRAVHRGVGQRQHDAERQQVDQPPLAGPQPPRRPDDERRAVPVRGGQVIAYRHVG